MSRKMSDAEAFNNLTEEEQSMALWHRGQAAAGGHGAAYHGTRENDFQADACRAQSDRGLDGWNAELAKGRLRG